MSRKARDELIRGIALRYVKASKKVKTTILDEAVKNTGLNRKYLISKINSLVVTRKTKDLIGRSYKKSKLKKEIKKRGVAGKPVKYNEAFRESLIKLWYTFDMMCPKRLLKLIRDNITELGKDSSLRLTSEIILLMQSVSESTANRILRIERQKYKGRGRSCTRSPGTALNSMIPVRAYYTMEERTVAGSFEIDTVAHCGFGSQGDSLWTLTLTDVATGAVYIRALKNKTQRFVLAALDDIKENALYPIRELHMDNGSEFKNYGFLSWCDAHGVEYTRSRSYHKNDNCFVESKNYSVVRNIVGYYRYAGEEAYEAMEDLYWHWERLNNLYYPSVKLLSKYRDGVRVKKTYDEPRSPLERLLNDESIDSSWKAKAVTEKESLPLLALKKAVDRRSEELIKLAVKEEMDY